MAEGTPDAVYYRIDSDLIEIDADGLVLREVHLTSDGRPKRACGPDEPTSWGDEIGSQIDQMRPGTPEFDQAWSGLGTQISRAEFEAAFAAGKDHPLPFYRYPLRDQTQEVGGCLVVTVVGFFALIAFLFAMAIFLQLLWAVVSNVLHLS